MNFRGFEAEHAIYSIIDQIRLPNSFPCPPFRAQEDSVPVKPIAAEQSLKVEDGYLTGSIIFMPVPMTRNIFCVPRVGTAQRICLLHPPSPRMSTRQQISAWYPGILCLVRLLRRQLLIKSQSDLVRTVNISIHCTTCFPMLTKS